MDGNAAALLVSPAKDDANASGKTQTENSTAGRGAVLQKSLEDVVDEDLSKVGLWKTSTFAGCSCSVLYRTSQTSLGPQEEPWKFPTFRGLKEPVVAWQVVSDLGTDSLVPGVLPENVVKDAGLDASKTWTAEFFVLGYVGRKLRYNVVVTASNDVSSACAFDALSLWKPCASHAMAPPAFNARILELFTIAAKDTTGPLSAAKPPAANKRGARKEIVVKEEKRDQTSPSAKVHVGNAEADQLQKVHSLLEKALYRQVTKKDKKPILELVCSAIEAQGKAQQDWVEDLNDVVGELKEVLNGVGSAVVGLNKAVVALNERLKSLDREPSPVLVVNKNTAAAPVNVQISGKKGKVQDHKKESRKRLDFDDQDSPVKFLECISCGQAKDDDIFCHDCQAFKKTGRKKPKAE